MQVASLLSLLMKIFLSLLLLLINMEFSKPTWIKERSVEGAMDCNISPSI